MLIFFSINLVKFSIDFWLQAVFQKIANSLVVFMTGHGQLSL